MGAVAILPRHIPKINQRKDRNERNKNCCKSAEYKKEQKLNLECR